MTNQNAKFLERDTCIIYHFNREGKDSFMPRIWGLDKSGNYKNLSEAKLCYVIDYTLTLPISFSTS